MTPASDSAAAHVAVTLDVTPGVPRVFQGFAEILDDADVALTRIGNPAFVGTI